MNVLIDNQTMTDIANAIRDKNGTDTQYKPSDMPQAIADISGGDTGIGSREWWEQVCEEKNSYQSMFAYTKVTTIPPIDTNNNTSMYLMFERCNNLLEIPPLDTSNVVNFSKAFYYCTALVKIGMLNMSKATQSVQMFYACRVLQTINFVPNSISISISFSDSPLLSDESIQSIIDGLITTTTAKTLTLHATVKGKLTDEQIATINEKGWTLA